MSFHLNPSWCENKKGVFLWNVSFLLFYLFPANLRPILQERKQEKQQGCRQCPKNKPETPHPRRRTLSLNMFLAEPLPGLLWCLPAPAHLLLVIGVRGHLSCDLWWQWSTSLVGPQEAVWSFDEAFDFSAKVWRPVAATLLSNELLVSCATKEIKYHGSSKFFSYSIVIKMSIPKQLNTITAVKLSPLCRALKDYPIKSKIHWKYCRILHILWFNYWNESTN